MDNIFCAAKWVWLEEYRRENVYINFYDTLSCASPGGSYRLHISADSQYAVYINDRFVSCGQYPDYPAYKVYDSITITDFLESGLNTVKICAYCQGEDSSTYRLGKAGILYTITHDGRGVVFSGLTTLACLNKAYRNGPVPKITPQLSFSFDYDAGKETFLVSDGSLSEFKAADTWENTLPLYPRPVKKLTIGSNKKGLILSQGVFYDNNKMNSPADRMQAAGLSYRSLTDMAGLHPPVSPESAEGIHFHATDGDGIYLVVDLLEEDVGYPALDINLPEDADIYIGYGEHLDDLRVRSSVGGRNFCFVYRGKAGRREFLYPFKRIGLRYLQLHIYSRSAVLHYAGIKPAYYPLSDTPFFKCSDHLHNKIYEVSKRTLQLCMHEHYEDCPWREQALYSMDSRTQMLCGYYCFGEYDFAKENIRLMALSLREDNLLELCSPANVSVTIPSFTAIFVTQLYEYLIFSGDFAFAREMLPVAKKVTDGFLERISPLNGLVPCYTETPYWNFYEWQDGLDGGKIARDRAIPVSYDLPLNAFVSMAFGSLSEIYRLLKMNEPHHYYGAAKKRLNLNIDSQFWNADVVAYATFIDDNGPRHYCELSNSLAVVCGASQGARADSILMKLKAGSLLPITLSCSIFKYEALMKKSEIYGDDIFNSIAEIWGRMLYSGATSFWETEKGAWDFDNAGSLCHGWSAIPLYIYFAYALGVKPDGNGEGNYLITPVRSGLTGICGKIVTRQGKEISL